MNELHDRLVEKPKALVTPKAYYKLSRIYRAGKRKRK